MLQDLVDAVDKLITTKINELHTAIPAKIEEFDPVRCTATVKPFGKMVLTNGKTLDYPKINDVPVFFPHASNMSALIVFPVKAGDVCLLIFSEQTLDNWKSNGTKNSELKYSLSNAVAIPGLFAHAPDAVAESVNSEAIVVKHDKTKIKICKDKIEIEAGSKVKISAQNLEANYAENAAFNCPTIEVTGDVMLTGNAVITGNLNVLGTITSGTPSPPPEPEPEKESNGDNQGEGENGEQQPTS